MAGKIGVSGRQYALLRGVSHTAVIKAIATGRIKTEADGSIVPEKADAEWEANSDPSQQRKNAFRVPMPSANSDPKATVKPVPLAALNAVNDALGDAPAPGDPSQPSFVRARLANEIIKASTARVRLAKMNGELVDRNKATAMIFELARRERDSWLNWPARIAANMAADFGLDVHLTQLTLEKYIRAHLADLAEVKLELR